MSAAGYTTAGGGGGATVGGGSGSTGPLRPEQYVGVGIEAG